MSTAQSQYAAAISDSLALWTVLKERAGLSVASTPDKVGYDDALVDDLKTALFPSEVGLFDVILEKHHLTVSTSELLRVFLSALQPLSMMQRDILKMLSAASAPLGEDALRVKFDFTGDDPLTLLLSEFKEQFRRLEEAIVTVPVINFDVGQLWKLYSELLDPDKDRRGVSETSMLPESLARWARQRVDSKGRQGIERFPVNACRSGIPEVDQRLERVVSLVAAIVGASRRRGATHGELRDYGYSAGADGDAAAREDGIPSRELWRLESDYWSVSMSQIIGGVLAEARSPGFDLAGFTRRFDAVEIPMIGSAYAEALIEQIEDLLNLPVWKRRNEVYSVWVGAQIWRTFKGCTVIFHPVDEVLSFSFRGSHIATVIAPNKKIVLEWWAERRTPAPPGTLRSAERTASIQPDYTILRAPLSVPAPEAVIVEVKQYKKYSRRNFSDALTDYAAVCTKAKVILASYGAVGPSVLESLDEDLRPRAAVFGELRPDMPATCEAFSTALGAALGVDICRLVPAPTVGHPITIRLTWGEQPQDLDLHVFYCNTATNENVHVCFNQPDDGNRIVLAEDVRTGRGPEIVRADVIDGVLSLVVHNYSKEVELSRANAVVEVTGAQGKPDATRRFNCPQVGYGEYWHVCRIALATNEISEIGAIETALSAWR